MGVAVAAFLLGRGDWAQPAQDAIREIASAALEPVAGVAPDSDGGDFVAVSPRQIRVVDGDTIRIGPERVRIEGIDTPEVGDRAECDYERDLADRATARARELFNSAQDVRIRRTGVDQYDRTLARVMIDGRDINDVLIAERLAVRWAGRQHDWCR